MTEILEKHVTSDGILKFIKYRGEDGAVCLGFEGFPWHTHPDLSESFVKDLLDDALIIAVYKKDGKILSVEVTDDPSSDLKYKSADETIEFRYWSGRKAA